MADSIKTNIMKEIGTLLETITDLKTVRRWKGKEIDLEVIPLPALFFYDEGETRERRNISQHGLLDLYLVAFFSLPLDDVDISGARAFSDDADNIQAQVHNLLFGSTNLTQLGVIMLEEGSIHKEYPNDIFSLLVMRYTLTYAHKFGDAFNRLQ